MRRRPRSSPIQQRIFQQAPEDVSERLTWSSEGAEYVSAEAGGAHASGIAFLVKRDEIPQGLYE